MLMPSCYAEVLERILACEYYPGGQPPSLRDTTLPQERMRALREWSEELNLVGIIVDHMGYRMREIAVNLEAPFRLLDHTQRKTTEQVELMERLTGQIGAAFTSLQLASKSMHEVGWAIATAQTSLGLAEEAEKKYVLGGGEALASAKEKAVS